jgi:hypothetical protein
MLPQVLTSLYEIKAQLQSSLSTRPEYRALQLLERSAVQLADALAPREAQIRISGNGLPLLAPTTGMARNQFSSAAALELGVQEGGSPALLDASSAGAAAFDAIKLAASASEDVGAVERGNFDRRDRPAVGPRVEAEAPATPTSRASFLPLVGAPQKIGVGRY